MGNEILEFECSAIDAQGSFLPEYTGYGQDISPRFVISNLSPAAKTIAITLEDMSHPIKGFTHWVIWNIPALDIIEKAVPAGKSIAIQGNINAKQGIAYGLHRYAGPKPPRGKSHIYRFTLYVLDCEIDLSANVFKKSLLKKAAGHIIQKGEISGEFTAR
ncbi:MAG: YbhB/YbcL family Raf kinase inhibitor-like protein [Ruminococcaceae bacterium]|nr:YbhB/YbcL family Raf kinase inhibitor-like protein [Oscillospiraceae bacterium]